MSTSPVPAVTAVVACAVMLTSALASCAGPHTPPQPPQPSGTRARDSGDIQRGFAMPTYSRDGYSSPQVSTELGRMVAAGVTWVQINPTWYQDGARTSSITPGWQTPTDTSVEHVVEAAHRLGMKVFLKPLVDLGPDGTGGYRGTIRPADPGAWFASYTRFIGHYAEVASRRGVEEFGVGTELAGTSGDRASWLRVVKAVRARYRGLVVYSANFDEYRHVRFWDALDLVGIDAYWPVSPRPTTDPQALRRAWDPIVRELAAFAARLRRHILFTEAGYTSQHGSTTAPWSWTNSRTPDQAEQAAAYEALLASLTGRPWWAGVFWWAWDAPLGVATGDPLSYSPHGKAAEGVIRRWWS